MSTSVVHTVTTRLEKVDYTVRLKKRNHCRLANVILKIRQIILYQSYFLSFCFVWQKLATLAYISRTPLCPSLISESALEWSTSTGHVYISEENTSHSLSTRNSIQRSWRGEMGSRKRKGKAFGKAETIQPCLLIDWPLRLMNISKAFQLQPLEASPVA